MKLRPANIALIVAISSVFACAVNVLAQRPEIESKNGHISPLMAEITYLNGTKKTEMILGMGLHFGDKFSAIGLDPEGVETTIWLDTIDNVDDISDSKGTFWLKNGKRVRLKSKYDSPLFDNGFYVANSDGGIGKVKLPQVKLVRFLKPARKDSDKNAMFDDWKYSPFTGEKLAPSS